MLIVPDARTVCARWHRTVTSAWTSAFYFSFIVGFLLYFFIKRSNKPFIFVDYSNICRILTLLPGTFQPNGMSWGSVPVSASLPESRGIPPPEAPRHESGLADAVPEYGSRGTTHRWGTSCHLHLWIFNRLWRSDGLVVAYLLLLHIAYLRLPAVVLT